MADVTSLSRQRVSEWRQIAIDAARNAEVSHRYGSGGLSYWDVEELFDRVGVVQALRMQNIHALTGSVVDVLRVGCAVDIELTRGAVLEDVQGLKVPTPELRARVVAHGNHRWLVAAGRNPQDTDQKLCDWAILNVTSRGWREKLMGVYNGMFKGGGRPNGNRPPRNNNNDDPPDPGGGGGGAAIVREPPRKKSLIGQQ